VVSRVAVIIVNYRTPALAVDCLRSLAGEDAGPHCRAVVVDNGSGDGSAAALAEAIHAHGWGAWAELLPLADNRGFAAGNNAALRQILAAPHPPDYLLLLNPDTVVRPGAVRALADFLDRHPRAGIAGSRLEDPDGTPQVSAFRFPSVLGEWENGVRLGLVTRLLHRHVVAPPVRPEAHVTDWVSGASLMVRRAVFEEVGLLDEGFFLYYEEVDFCRRAARAGWPCWYVPASRVVHLVSQSTGVDGDGRTRRPMPAYWFASRRRYFAKHHRRLDALCADVGWAVGRAGWRLRRRWQHKPDTDPPGLLGDFVRYNCAAYFTSLPPRGTEDSTAAPTGS
jgi:GT2 family glycosyltransferase